MELKGKLIAKLMPVTGTSSKGEWVKQEIIIETQETYPKKICVSFWKDQVIKIQAVPIGSELEILINVESREYNGKWFTEVKAWKFTANGQAVKVEDGSNIGTEQKSFIEDKPEDNLPF